MKIFVVFLVIFLSISDGRGRISNDIMDSSSSTSTTTLPTNPWPTLTSTGASNTTTSDTTTNTLSPSDDVSLNVTWTYVSETNVTSIVMTVKNLKTSEWAAIGLGQEQKMVNNFHPLS